MVKLRNFLIATIVFSTAGGSPAANARESFYDLNSAEPSVSVNLGALDRLEQPAYALPQAPVARTLRVKTSSRKQAAVQPALNQPSVKQMPVVSDNLESTPVPPPRLTKSTMPRIAPKLPTVEDNLTSAMHDVSPPPVPEPPKPITPPVPPAPLPSIKGHEDNSPPLPPAPKAPVKTIETPPSLPPALPSIKSNPNPTPDLPPPPPMPKAYIAPPANISANSAGPGPRVIVSSKAPPVVELPKVPETKATDNIVALPPAPPAPPPLKSIADKSVVAASKDLPAPSKPPSNDMLSLPPPLPPSLPDDVDKKIAEQKAKIDAQIQSSAVVKNAVTPPPIKNVVAGTSLPELPPLPPTPPPLDNSLPPLPVAQVSGNSSVASNSKASDLPPLDTVLSKSQSAPTPPDLKDSMPAKETVMMAPDKIPAVLGGANGPITMSYSEAETEVPLVEKAKLDNVIAQLEADKNKTVTLIAYASGTPEQASQAKRTSLARVLAVRKYMMERNIDAERINPRPLGNHSEGGVPDRVDIIFEKGSKV